MIDEKDDINNSTYGAVFAVVILTVIIISLAYFSIKNILERHAETKDVPGIKPTEIETGGRVIYEKKDGEITDKELDKIINKIRKNE